MKIYLAARYGRNAEMRGYADDLRALGHEVTAHWITGDHDLKTGGHSEEDAWSVVWAKEDLADLTAAGLVVSFTEGPGDVAGRSRGGRHVEFGMALALNKNVIVVGHRENVFHHLPEVEFYPTWVVALAGIRAGYR